MRTRSLLIALLWLAPLSLIVAPARALAQDDDMAFDEDESMSFDEEDAVEATDPNAPAPTKGRLLSVIVVAGEGVSTSQRVDLQDKLLVELEAVRKRYTIDRGDAVMPLIEERGTDTCVREPICLGSVGSEAQTDYLLIARASQQGSGYRFVFDLFDVQDRLFVKTKSYDDLGSFGAVLDTVPPAVRYAFDLRTPTDTTAIGDGAGSSTIQTVFAYTTAGLAALCIGGGVYFGLDASSQEDELKNSPRMGDRYADLTQRQARQRVQEIQSTATTANVFYGLGLALGVTSAVLFLVDFGSDVDEEDYAHRLQLSPILSPEVVGVGASMRF